MNTQSTEDRADEALRALLAQADPEAGAPQPEPAHLLDRVRAAAVAGEAPAAGTAPEWTEIAPTQLAEHRSFTQKHWQGMLMAAAGVATLALAAGSVLPGLTRRQRHLTRRRVSASRTLPAEPRQVWEPTRAQPSMAASAPPRPPGTRPSPPRR